MEQIQQRPEERGAIDKSICLADKANNTRSARTIQPDYSVADVDQHLHKFGIVGKATKRTRMVAWLHLCSINGHTVTRFDAAKVGCTCWNTSVSEFTTKAGLRVERRTTTRQTRFNIKTQVSEYWFNDAELPAVEKWLRGSGGMQ